MGTMKGHEGKVVLVTGANSGIGEATAALLVEAGANVYGTARRKAVLQEVRAKHPRIHWVLADVRDAVSARKAVEAVVREAALSDVEKKQITFPVLTDKGNRVAREYGLVYSLSDALRGLQTGFGNPIPKFNGDETWELPMQGTFVVDRGGVVRLAHVDPDYMKRLESAAMLDTLRALRS